MSLVQAIHFWHDNSFDVVLVSPCSSASAYDMHLLNVTIQSTAARFRLHPAPCRVKASCKVSIDCSVMRTARISASARFSICTLSSFTGSIQILLKR